MIEVYERHVAFTPVEQAETSVLSPTEAQAPIRQLLLTHEQRSRGRLRLPQPDGVEVRLFLERGEPLQLGEYLRGTAGELLLVTGAVEEVATALCEDWLAFSKACYHLGNRHVKIQIGERWLRIARDHVLEEMLLGLGLAVKHELAVFDPERGAYAPGHSHSHGHDHSHEHSHEDEHDRAHRLGLAHAHADALHQHTHGHGSAHGTHSPSTSLLLRHAHKH
jgi:urease accessory protein